MNKPLVAIIGRANVGKSTLFNRFLGTPIAITDAQAGTTRDTTTRLVSWNNKSFWLSDSAGLEKRSNTDLDKVITANSRRLFSQADILLFVIDGQTGLTPEDRAIANELKPYRSKILLVVSKVDHQSIKQKYANQKIMGFHTWMVSGKNGSGSAALLDHINSLLKTSATLPPAINLVLLGKPNVGKSSLINALSGESHSLVHDLPHTTRDSQFIWLNQMRYSWCLVDTAGIRRRSRAADRVEHLSIKQTIDNLESGNIIVLILDSSSDFTWQDQGLADSIVESKKPAMILINKIDTLKKLDKKIWDKTLARWMPMLGWAPKLFVSAKTGAGLTEVLPTASGLYENNRYHMNDADEEKVDKRLQKFFAKNPKIKFLKIRQIKTDPASIEVKLISKEGMPRALPDIIIKTIRQSIPQLAQVPIKLAINIRAKL